VLSCANVEVHSSSAFMVFSANVGNTQESTLGCGTCLTSGIYANVVVIDAVLGDTIGSLWENMVPG